MKVIMLSEKTWNMAWDIFFNKLELAAKEHEKTCQCANMPTGEMKRSIVYNAHTLKQDIEREEK